MYICKSTGDYRFNFASFDQLNISLWNLWEHQCCCLGKVNYCSKMTIDQKKFIYLKKVIFLTFKNLFS